MAFSFFKLALAQINPVVGDIEGNLRLIRESRDSAQQQGADLVMFPELCLSGYPPEDLVMRPAFVESCRTALLNLALETGHGMPALLIGLPFLSQNLVYNAYACLDEGQICGVSLKHNLPNYGVFDEKRVFASAPLPSPILWRGIKLGLPICEDIWGGDTLRALASKGADLVLVPNGSPYWRGKGSVRRDIMTTQAKDFKRPLVYLNQVGGQDELVFDGDSFIADHEGRIIFHMPAFAPALHITEWRLEEDQWYCLSRSERDNGSDVAMDYRAAMLGLRDYVHKSGFQDVLLGLSGGIDSALVAALAVDALGAEHVKAFMLPYHYTAQNSLDDAEGCAKALGIDYQVLPVAAAIEGVLSSLKNPVQGLALENLQSRVRGTMLMTLSNASGAMLLTTGNKSEMATGYATLYGDMNGGYNPLKDMYKTTVQRLSSLRNRWKPKEALGPDIAVIPHSILTKPPSAELRENQTDQDSLPPYEVLDGILEMLVEDEASLAHCVAQGHDAELVEQVLRLLARSEFKRRQSAPGPKLTRRNFGKDRRYPIINGFRESLD
jgi:NAD+ synthase